MPTVTDEDVGRAALVFMDEGGEEDSESWGDALRRVLEDYASHDSGVTEGALRPPREAEHGESPPSSPVAIANAALPDTDPRKITREHIRACRRELNDWVEDRDEILKRLAAVLESYLPPEAGL